MLPGRRSEFIIRTSTKFIGVDYGLGRTARNLHSLKQWVRRLAVEIPILALHIAVRENGEIVCIDRASNTVDYANNMLVR